jgi:hypothetical protein
MFTYERSEKMKEFASEGIVSRDWGGLLIVLLDRYTVKF